MNIYAEVDAFFIFRHEKRGISAPLLSQISMYVYMEGKHIGISNTKHRFELFTGKKDALKIKSKLHEGTLIIITLRREYER